MMTRVTSRTAGTFKIGLLALSLVAAGTGAASARGFGGGGHMGGGFSEHMGGGDFHEGFHGAPAFHADGNGTAFFLPHAFHVHDAYHDNFRPYGFPAYGRSYAFAPYDVFRDVGPNCFDRVVKLGTRGHYHYVREDSCT